MGNFVLAYFRSFIKSVGTDGAFYIFLNVSNYYGKRYGDDFIVDSVSFAHAALNEGIALIPGKPFGNDDCVRLSYAVSEDDILLGVARLKKFFEKLY